LLEDPVHGLKRSILIGLNRPHHAAIVLLREKSLGDVNKQVDVQSNGGQQDCKCNGGMIQHRI
jgi:hypothetical protein